MPRPKQRRQTLSALDLVEFLSKAEDESVAAPTNNVLNEAKDDTNMLSKIKQSGNVKSSLVENYGGSVHDMKCNSKEETAIIVENERIVSEEDHIREFVKITFAERDNKAAKSTEVVELSKVVTTSTKYNLLSQRLMFPEKFPHEPSSLESKRALLLSMNSTLKEAEVQRNTDVSTCEAFTRCTCGKGKGKSSYEYKDIDTGKVISPKEYEIRCLTYLQSLRPHPAPISHSCIDLLVDRASKNTTKTPTMLDKVPAMGSQPRMDGLSPLPPPSSISTTFSPIKTQPLVPTCSPLCGADAAIKSERGNNKHKPRRMTLSPKSAQEMMLQALDIGDNATVEQLHEQATPSAPVPMSSVDLSSGSSASEGTRVGASLNPLAPALPSSPIKCSPLSASQPPVGSNAVFPSGSAASITGEREGQDGGDDHPGCDEAADDVIPPSVAPSPLDSLFCDDFTFADFKYDKGNDKGRGRGKSQRKARESFLMPAGALLDEDEILNMLESDTAVDQKQQQQQHQHHDDCRKQDRKQVKEVLEMEDSLSPIAQSRGQGQKEGGNFDEISNGSILANFVQRKNTVTTTRTVTCPVCHHVNNSSEAACLSCESDMSMRRATRSQRRARESFVLPTSHEDAMRDMLLGQAEGEGGEEEEVCEVRDVQAEQTHCCQLNAVANSESTLTLISSQRECADSIGQVRGGTTQGKVDELGSSFTPAQIGIDPASISSTILDFADDGVGLPAEVERDGVDEDADGDGGDIMSWMTATKDIAEANPDPEQALASAESPMEQPPPSVSSPSFSPQQQSSPPPTTTNNDDKLLNEFDLELGNILSGGAGSGEFDGEGDRVSVSMCIPFNFLVRGLAVDAAPGAAALAQCGADIMRSSSTDEGLCECPSLSCNRGSEGSQGKVQWDQALGFGDEAESDSDEEDWHDGHDCHDKLGGHDGRGGCDGQDGDGSSSELCSELPHQSISSSSQSPVSQVPSAFERLQSLSPDTTNGLEVGSPATSVRVDGNAPLSILNDTLLMKAENWNAGEVVGYHEGGSVSIAGPSLMADNELTNDENLHDKNFDYEDEEEHEEDSDDNDQVQNVLHHRDMEMRQFMHLEAGQGLGGNVQAHPAGISNVGSIDSLNWEADFHSVSVQQDTCVDTHNPSLCLLTEEKGGIEEVQAKTDISCDTLSLLSDFASLSDLSPQHQLYQDPNHEAVDVYAGNARLTSPHVRDHNTESKVTQTPELHTDIATAAPQAVQLLPSPLASSYLSKGQTALDGTIFELDPADVTPHADVTPDVDASCPASARGDAIAEVLRSCDLGDDVDVDVGAGTELFFVMDLEECFKRVVVEGAARVSTGKAKTSSLPLPVHKTDGKSLSQKAAQGPSNTKQSGVERIAAAEVVVPPPSIGFGDRIISPHGGSSSQVPKGIASGRKPKLPKGATATAAAVTAAAKVDFSPDEQIVFRKRRLSTERGRASLAGRSSVSASTSATATGQGLASHHQSIKPSDRHTSRRASIHTMNGVAAPGGGNRSKKRASLSSSSSSTINAVSKPLITAAPSLATIGPRSKQKREDGVDASKVRGSKSAISTACADEHLKLSVEIVRTAEQLVDEGEAMHVVKDLATARMLLRTEIARWKYQWEVCSAHAAQCAQKLGLAR